MDYNTYNKEHEMQVPESGEGAALPASVPVTARQWTALFEELGGKRDGGTLRFALREGRILGGTAAELSHVAYRLDMSATAKERVNGKATAHTKHLRNVLARLAAAGITPQRPEIEVSGERQGGAGAAVHVPESEFAAAAARREHPIDVRCDRRLDVNVHVPGCGCCRCAKCLRRHWNVEKLRGKSAKGREAGKRAFSSKKAARADAGFMRGDGIFRTSEGLAVNELVEWIRAGYDDEIVVESRVKGAAGKARKATALAADPIERRIARAVDATLRKRGKLRISWIAWHIVGEDVKAGLFPARSYKSKLAYRRYRKAVEKVIDGIKAKRVVENTVWQGRAAGRGIAKLAPTKAARPAREILNVQKHEHEWRVSPQRTRRTCEGCGKIERKIRGRWSPYIAPSGTSKLGADGKTTLGGFTAADLRKLERQRQAANRRRAK